MSATHPDTPWETRDGLVFDCHGDVIAKTYGNAIVELHRAERIVRCVNSHDRLVEALRTLVNNPIVSGMSARIRGEANERAVPDAYAAAEAALKEAGAE